MSDPVSNAEIEDVLSSIRRLVSSGDREKSHAHAGASNESSDKLVLTPALRVDALQDSAETDSTPAHGNAGVAALGDRFEFRHVPQDDETEASDQDNVPLSLDEDYKVDVEETAEPEVADAGGEADAAPETGDLDTTEESDPSAQHAHDPDMAETEGQHPQSAEPAEPELQDDQEQSQIAAIGDRIAEVEDAVAARDDEWEPDGESDDPYSGSEVTPMAWEDYGPEPAEDDSEGVAGGAGVIFAHPSYKRDVSADHPVSENGGAGGKSANAPGSQDDAAKADTHESPLWSDDGDTIIDEDTLRDMVSEIVRQELQGALGERITRNVRKLVRREIHRAMTSQEFD